MLLLVEDNLSQLPDKASADSGYFSDANVENEALEQVDLYIAAGRYKRNEQVSEPDSQTETPVSTKEKMKHKLRTQDGRAVYRMRKAIVEPVFGQIKDVRGFRQFSFRGLEAVECEWALICLTHNLLKLFRAQVRSSAA